MDIKKVQDIKEKADQYLLKNDPSYKKNKEYESMIKQMNEAYNKFITEFKHAITVDKNSREMFSSSVAQFKETVPTALTTMISSITTALHKDDAQSIKVLVEKLQSIEKAISSFKIPKQDFPKTMSISEAKQIVDELIEINSAIRLIPKPEKVNIPTEVSFKESNQIIKELDFIQKLLTQLPNHLSKQTPITFDAKPITDAIEQLRDEIKKLPKEYPSIEFPELINIGNFPPQKIPTPVTHMSINSLRGFVKTTASTVTTSLTPLPSYGVLPGRRAIFVYNNSSNTIYIGGSDVTSANGMPVAVGTHSPIIDAGVDMIVYGIAETGSNNVRVMEVSDEASGR